MTSSTSIPISTSSSDNAIVRTKIENATEGLSSNCFNYLFNRVLPGSRGKENALTICDYMSSIKYAIATLWENSQKSSYESPFRNS